MGNGGFGGGWGGWGMARLVVAAKVVGLVVGFGLGEYFQIIDCEVFIRLKNEHGERYEEFMKGKLVAVVGNITEHPCLGMDADLVGAIANQIDVIVNIAADTRWHARGMDPMILSYGEGQMQGILADPNGIIDIVPVDILANAIIVAIANHAISGKLGVHIYHLASSMVKPLQLQTLFKYCCNYFTLHPFKNSRGEIIKVEEMDFYASLDEYILAGMNSKPSNEKLYSHLVRIAAIYEPIMLLRLRFNNMNTQNLFEGMSSEEKKIFNFDVNCIDWEDYFMNIQLRGLTKHILIKKILSPKL
uniref:Fatty acyl-CoA reductase n=1 Tax=Chenopodium quinoa TaxID=63459 RepID=A0A803M6A8_CHEQI